MSGTTTPFATLVAQARAEFFPMALPDGVVGTLITDATFRQLIDLHWPTVFPDVPAGGAYHVPDERKPKAGGVRQHFIETVHRDHIALAKDGVSIGWLFGEQSDAATYHMRNSAILPEHQGKGIYSNALQAFLAYLRAIGFERVTSHHSTHNIRVLIPKLKAGFYIGGTEMDERYGSLVRLVCHLNEDRKDFFRKRFG